jgi:hypothetical protein
MAPHSVTFAECDLCKPLDDPANAGVLREVGGFDLVCFSYCLIENAIDLQRSGFVFIDQLLSKVNYTIKTRTQFVFTFVFLHLTSLLCCVYVNVLPLWCHVEVAVRRAMRHRSGLLCVLFPLVYG